MAESAEKLSTFTALLSRVLRWPLLRDEFKNITTSARVRRHILCVFRECQDFLLFCWFSRTFFPPTHAVCRLLYSIINFCVDLTMMNLRWWWWSFRRLFGRQWRKVRKSHNTIMSRRRQKKSRSATKKHDSLPFFILKWIFHLPSQPNHRLRNNSFS